MHASHSVGDTQPGAHAITQSPTQPGAAGKSNTTGGVGWKENTHWMAVTGRKCVPRREECMRLKVDPEGKVHLGIEGEVRIRTSVLPLGGTLPGSC